MQEGRLRIFTKKPRRFNVNTKYLNASVEGTEFVVTVNENEKTEKASVDVFDGKVRVCNRGDFSPKVEKGFRAYAENQDKITLEKQIVKPENAVHWSLYYPPVGPASDEFSDLYILANQGEASAVRNILESKLEEKISGLTDMDPYLLALLSTIQLVQNDLNLATKNANQAVENARKKGVRSAAAFLALSYTQQANFDLDSALQSAEKALMYINQDETLIESLIHSRIAELELALGNIKSAIDNAGKAKLKDSSYSRTHTVLGFTYLSNFDYDKAKESFNEAIRLSDTDPDPHIGLGLIAVRKDDLDEAVKQKSIAVSISPEYSLARSYLGKTYFHDNSIKKSIHSTGKVRRYR